MPAMKKLPARYLHFVMPLILSILMTFVVSLVTTVRVAGVVPGFVPMWICAWAWSWVVAFPTLLVVLPFARRLALRFVHPPAP